MLHFGEGEVSPYLHLILQNHPLSKSTTVLCNPLHHFSALIHTSSVGTLRSRQGVTHLVHGGLLVETPDIRAECQTPPDY